MIRINDRRRRRSYPLLLGVMRSLVGGLIAVATTVAATIVTWVMTDVAHVTMFVFFLAAVAVVASTRGLGAGLVTLALCAASILGLFLAPAGDLRDHPSAVIARLTGFGFAASLLLWLTVAVRRARQGAEHHASRAEEALRTAEATSASYHDFVITLSHEIRTPINAMLGYADLLEAGAAGPVSKEQAAFVARMRMAAKHLLTLVNQVLDVAKADTGNLDLHLRRVRVADVTRSAVALVHPQAATKDVALDVMARDHLEFVGDEDRVRQILVNLLANAVRFAPAGSYVTVDAGDGSTPRDIQPAAGDHMVWIRVSDSGPGIPAEDQERIFEPFKQARAAGTVAPGGTGLGLALSRRLARLMRGELTVISEDGHGSAFTLWLPR